MPDMTAKLLVAAVVFLKGGENLLQNGKNRVTNYTDDKLAFLKGALHLKG